jgi:hypothetical protein
LAFKATPADDEHEACSGACAKTAASERICGSLSAAGSQRLADAEVKRLATIPDIDMVAR